ncbi:ArgS-related anticodon-binding protein NrtL [Streptomyces katrae]|uniref:arginine--tRNA ligase n=1 Tax=Streptomyces katrae TaxID=68223 RepID=A0A0F4J948_9ACTN|nr:DALR anticodon-binding domain-containing protein [Streptomyces katrae]KJY30705.1 arginyl-tRNA synthetase [Streptomyces katrae]
MIPADLSHAVVHAVRRAVEAGELGGPVPARVVVERTRPGGVGEYASPVALRMGRGAEGALVLAKALALEPGIATVEVTGPGFLNFTLAPLSAAELVRDVAGRAGRYGCLPVAPQPAAGTRREDVRGAVVRGAVVRIREGQGLPGEGEGLSVAPVARRDGDVVARYGAAAAVWAMVVVPARETPVFGDGLLVQGEENEVFRVRYAHARARALTRNAADLGFRGEPGDVDAPALLRALADHPLALEAAAHHRAPERLARHLVVVADALLDFQHQVLPLGDEKPSAAHRARLALAEAAGAVLAGGLALLGIDAPHFL